MMLGRVIGTVWATRKDDGMDGLKLLVVERCGLDLAPQSGFVVAVDACEAGVGEVVLVAQGSSARQTRVTDKKPVDAVVMAIVENLEVLDPKALEGSYEARRAAVARELEAQAAL